MSDRHAEEDKARMGEQALRRGAIDGAVLRLPGADFRLTAEQALRAAIDNQVFAALRDLEPLDGGRAVQAVYIALIRRLPNVIPDRKRIAIDTGFSESSVKRAIKLLELCRLVTVERKAGLGSVYHLADIRSVEIASECASAIRKVLRSGGRVTSEPGNCASRATSEPGSRVRSGREVGSLVTPKDAMKIQAKQQGAVAARRLTETLARWGLLTASYLATPGHKQGIPELAENPELAAKLVDATMRKAAWSAGAGVGSKVAFLREQVPEVFARLKSLTASREGEPRREIPKASRTVSGESEQERDAAEAKLNAMSDTEFTEACERLFAGRPGLRKLYGGPDRTSRGLRVLLVEALRKSLLLTQSHKMG